MPPTPLILAGWSYSNDVQKAERWRGAVAGALSNDCGHLVTDIPASEFHMVEIPTEYAVGPFGGPMFRAWAFGKKRPPESEQLRRYLNDLRLRWLEISGDEIGSTTRPLAFTGRTARRLLVRFDEAAKAPWDEWGRLSPIKTERYVFTLLRRAVNAAIAPHEVDHIDFTTQAAK